jgi:hypothetical protein
MAFGIMVTKWQILKAPLSIRLKNIPVLFGAIIRLHNYCLKMGEGRKKLMKVYRVPGTLQLPCEPQIFGCVPSKLSYMTFCANSFLIRI